MVWPWLLASVMPGGCLPLSVAWEAFPPPFQQATGASASTSTSDPATRQQVIFDHGSPAYQTKPYKKYTLVNGAVSYGPTTLAADLIEYYPEGRPASADSPALPPGDVFATGNVSVTDPIATLAANTLHFNVITHTGSGASVSVVSEDVRFNATDLVITPDQWRLNNVFASPATGHRTVTLQARTIVLRPGIRASAYGTQYRLFGWRVFGLHRQVVNFQHRPGGTAFPVPTYSSYGGVGVRFNPSQLIDPKTAITAQSAVSQFQYPSYGLQITRCFLPTGETNGTIVPESDLNERFDFGYLDAISVPNPQSEYEALKAKRDALSLGAFYNIAPIDRVGNDVFNKPVELVYDRSVPIGYGFQSANQARYEDIQQVGNSGHLRLNGSTSIASPVLRLGPTLTTRFRGDAATFQGGGESFSWIHSESDLIYRPNLGVRLAAGWVNGKQYGVPLFLSDELYSAQGFNFRGDFSLGPRRLSILYKLDSVRGTWYDREFLVAQALGPLEAFVSYRTFPSQVAFGISLRLSSRLEQLQQRVPQRPGAATARLPD